MESITFKQLTKEDMPLFISWSQKPHVKDIWFLEGYASVDQYYQTIEGNGYDYGYIIHINATPIGYIQCSDLYAYRTKCPNPKGVFTHEDPGTFCVDIFIGEEEYLNKGYGTQTVKAFVKKLLQDFKAKKILIDPACSNKRAIRCYEKVGFKILRNEHDGTEQHYIMEYMQNNDELKVVPWSSEFEERAYQLLHQYEETSLYILSDIREYGTKLTDDIFSGNFKCVINDEKVVAVFVLNKAGNLNFQTDHANDYSSIIMEECLKEPLALKGALGDWDLVQSIHAYARRQLPHLKEQLYKKEILFRIKVDHLMERSSHYIVRHLTPSDYMKA